MPGESMAVCLGITFHFVPKVLEDRQMKEVDILTDSSVNKVNGYG